MAKEHAERVGQRIRERRLELGLTQPVLARAMTDAPGVTADYISKWERGEHKPSDDHLEMLAAALETTIVDLVAGPIAERDGAGGGSKLGAAVGDPETPDMERLERRLTRIEGKLDDLLAHADVERAADEADDIIDEARAGSGDAGSPRSGGRGG